MESAMGPRYALPARRRAACSPPRQRIKMKRVEGRLWPVTALTLLLGACSLAPPLKTPNIPTADAYKEIGPWTQAQPADRLPRDSWWTLYGNAELDGLQKKLIDGSPTLAAPRANYAQARALADQARAGLFPSLGLSASATPTPNSPPPPPNCPTTPPHCNPHTSPRTP